MAKSLDSAEKLSDTQEEKEAVWFERGPKREAIYGSFNHRHTSRWKLRTRVLGES